MHNCADCKLKIISLLIGCSLDIMAMGHICGPHGIILYKHTLCDL